MFLISTSLLSSPTPHQSFIDFNLSLQLKSKDTNIQFQRRIVLESTFWGLVFEGLLEEEGKI